MDIDGCHDDPCVSPSVCSDNSPEEHKNTSVAYKCDKCIPGYIQGNEKKCVGRYHQLLGVYVSFSSRFYGDMNPLWKNIYIKGQIMLTLVNDYGEDLVYLFFDRCG